MIDYEQIQRSTEAFAQLNGWKWSQKQFTFRQLAGLRRSDDRSPIINYVGTRVIDHPIWFRAEGEPAAFVTQPYLGTLLSMRRYVEAYGLDVFESPRRLASLWNPGGTLFFIFVPRGGTVRWLPEQEQTT